MKSMAMKREVYEHKKLIEKIFKVIFIILMVSIFYFLVSKAVYVAFDMPRAAIADGEIKYFEIPSVDGKSYSKIYPGTEKFQELKKGEYTEMNVAPDALRQEFKDKLRY